MSPRFEVSERNHGIDLLRGLAVLLVILFHINIRIPARQTDLARLLPTRALWTLFTNGYEAVYIFFTISGFLIAGQVFAHQGSLGSVQPAPFYRRRLARIAPCLLALITALSLLALSGANDYRISGPRVSLGGAIWAAVGLHMNVYLAWVGQLPAGWDVLWSLSIEEVFYLGFPIFCLLSRRCPHFAIFLLGLFALSLPALFPDPHINRNWSNKAYLPGMAAIAIGIVTARVRSFIRSEAVPATVLTCIGIALVGSVLVYEDRLHMGMNALLLLCVGTAALLTGLSLKPPRGILTRWTCWLQSIGRRSYEIYLSHMFVVLGGIALFRMSGAPPAVGWCLYAPLIFGAALLGEAIGRWFSDPADRWLRRPFGTVKLFTVPENRT